MRKCGLITEKGHLVPLKDVQVEIQISGFVAHVVANLQYENNEDTPIEAQFTFPLDDGSAVYKFEAVIDNRHIVAECQEKEEARKTYDDAIEAGDTAMLLEEDDTAGDIFRCLVGNLPPKSAAKLLMGYVIELPVEHDGKLRFTLPVILNPRYSPNVGGLEGAKGASYALQQKDIPYSFKLSASVDGTKEVKSITASQPHIDVEIGQEKRQAKVTFNEDFTFDADVRVFVEYENPYEAECLVENGDSEKSGFLAEDVLMLNLFPKVDIVGSTNKGEYIFVLDRSGSMGFGQNRIKHAKEALLLFLKSLPVGCYFNIVSFGSRYQFLFSEGSKEYTEESLNTATNELKSMGADFGGTEILQPLEAIYRNKPIDGHPRQIFLLTDGEVRNVQQVINITKKNVSNTRMFSIGIGEGASTSLVNGVARAGNGKAEFIKDSERMQPKIVALLKYAMQPSITNVTVGWELPAGVTAMTIPDVPPCLFDSDRLILYAMLQGNTQQQISGKIFINGKTDKGPANFSANFFFDKTAVVSNHAPFHRLAAKAQIKLLEDQEGESKKNKMEIITVSVASNMVSKYTSFIAIDKDRKEKVEGKHIRRNVPIMAACMVPLQESFGFNIDEVDCCLADIDMFDSASQSEETDQDKQMNSLSCSLMSVGGGVRTKMAKKGGFFPSFSNPFKGLFGKKSQSTTLDTLICAAPPPPRMMSNDMYANPRAAPPPPRMMRNARRKRDVAPQRTREVDVFECMDETYADPDEASPPLPMMRNARRKKDVAPQRTKQVDVLECRDDYVRRFVVEDDEDDLNIVEDSEDPMMKMISLQGFSGEWKLMENVCKMLKVESKVMKELKLSQDDSITATLAVLVWLEVNFKSQFDEWEMIRNKATAWLLKQGLDEAAVKDKSLKIHDALGTQFII